MFKQPIEDYTVDIVYFSGYTRVYHTGGITTYKSRVWLYPDLNLGFYIQTNGPDGPESSVALTHILYHLTDIFLGTEFWRNASQACEAIERHAERSIVEPTQPEKSLQDYEGTYRHPGFPEIRVFLNESNLLVRVGRFYEARLVHVGKTQRHLFTTFMQGVYWYTEPGSDYFKFIEDNSGRIVSVSFSIGSPNEVGLLFAQTGFSLETEAGPNYPVCLSKGFHNAEPSFAQFFVSVILLSWMSNSAM